MSVVGGDGVTVFAAAAVAVAVAGGGGGVGDDGGGGGSGGGDFGDCGVDAVVLLMAVVRSWKRGWL